MGTLYKNIQLRLEILLPFINNLPDNVICNIAIYADDTTLYYKCEQASDLWQQLAGHILEI